MAQEAGGQSRGPALLEGPTEPYSNPTAVNKGEARSKKKEEEAIYSNKGIEENRRKNEDKNLWACRPEPLSPSLMAVWKSMPVREECLSNCLNMTLKPHAYSYLNLSLVYSVGLRDWQKHFVTVSLRDLVFLLLALHWSWVGILQCGNLCSVPQWTFLYQNRQYSPGDQLVYSLSPVPILSTFGSLMSVGVAFLKEYQSRVHGCTPPKLSRATWWPQGW